jgi:hypothetical protein
MTVCIQDAALAPARQGFCVPDGGWGRWLPRKGAGFQRCYLHSGRVRGGVTQLPGDATAVIGCWSWVKRAFILPITRCIRQTGILANQLHEFSLPEYSLLVPVRLK